MLQRPIGPWCNTAASTIYRVSGTHAKRRMAHPREPYFSFFFPSSLLSVSGILFLPLVYKREGRHRSEREINQPIDLAVEASSNRTIETWELLPLSSVCNPYYKLSAGNTSSSKLDVGTFDLNQYNPCVLLAHHLGQTCNIQIYSLVLTRNTDSWRAR